MKEKPTDGEEVRGFHNASDGWHIIAFDEGIGFIPGKGGEGVYQNEKGNRTYKLPAKVADENDPENGFQATQLVTENQEGKVLANILLAAGLWPQLEKAFPGDDVDIFEERVMKGVIKHLPGKTCYAKIVQDKKGNPRAIQFATAAKYKELIAEEKKAGVGKSAKTEKAAPAGAPATEATGWD